MDPWTRPRPPAAAAAGPWQGFQVRPTPLRSDPSLSHDPARGGAPLLLLAPVGRGLQGGSDPVGAIRPPPQPKRDLVDGGGPEGRCCAGKRGPHRHARAPPHQGFRCEPRPARLRRCRPRAHPRCIGERSTCQNRWAQSSRGSRHETQRRTSQTEPGPLRKRGSARGPRAQACSPRGSVPHPGPSGSRPHRLRWASPRRSPHRGAGATWSNDHGCNRDQCHQHPLNAVIGSAENGNQSCRARLGSTPCR